MSRYSGSRFFTMNFDTSDSRDYIYYPITKRYLKINVRTAHDARICLRTNLNEDSDCYEIIIGGWNNTKSVMKKNKYEPPVAEDETENLLGYDNFNYFWLQWSCDGYVAFGLEDEESAILKYFDREPFLINYIGFSTAFGATGNWTVDGCTMTALAIRPQMLETSRYWVPYDADIGLPYSAVPADDAGEVFIGRVHHKRSITPGFINDSNNCVITWGGRTHHKSQFQVLCNLKISWVKCSWGAVPLHALPAGETEDGFALFVGRIKIDGQIHVGKIQPNHQVCYMPIDNEENSFDDYEVLVINDSTGLEYIGR